ncbi:hypothetical protein ASPACDRAFT_44621 [Aspergillus aculeatus ATCC 16872]|uniref:Phosphoglycerate mutase-like protein n=1 Tax=Aspergillus aculeatus (strain ATCC 16872 / CBS 172.66 / WB 5094) TaxID=690307 RepID=A0A1L9WS78_ASPA1|nr:uncharacterized protein ASPACDRAFT_44621 [Aspergillus aculeatus ATCC 16872]OJJ98992.1 hypothetical protein ASPACDRAFT_44621 [Aspergillus aculeatus ATCC 16872]
MPGLIHLVRHAEGLHNLRQDYEIHDAPLSERGFNEADLLGQKLIYRYSDRVGTIMSSPLRRSIQTSLTAFRQILNPVQYPANTGVGAKSGLMLMLDPRLREFSGPPCNTGSSVSELMLQFPALDQLQQLNPTWFNSPGHNQPSAELRQEILGRLEQMQTDLHRGFDPDRTDIVVVTHDGIIRTLAPGIQIGLGQWRSFELVRGGNGTLSLEVVPESENSVKENILTGGMNSGVFSMASVSTLN